jgi:hypothetical protein
MNPTETVRISDATYSRPFRDHEGRPLVAVEYDDGERFVTYAVTPDVLEAWAAADAPHGFADATSDTPEICKCGAAFVEGYHLHVVKAAHLAAF